MINQVHSQQMNLMVGMVVLKLNEAKTI